MEVATLVALTALVAKLTSALKYVSARDWPSLVTQAVVWIIGIGVAFLAGATDLAMNVVIQGVALTDMDSAGKVLTGFALASTASFGYDALTKTKANEPPLLSSSTPKAA